MENKQIKIKDRVYTDDQKIKKIFGFDYHKMTDEDREIAIEKSKKENWTVWQDFWENSN